MSIIRVLFLFQSGTNWLNMGPIYEAMHGDERFEPTVWTAPSDISRTDFREPGTAILDEAGIPYVRGAGPSLEVGQFDAVVIGTPYDSVRAPEFRVPYLKARIPHLIYIPYALEMDGGEMTKIRQYGLDAHQMASAIFVRSEFSRKMFREHCQKGDKHVFATGLPRLDGLYDLDSRFRIDPNLIEEIGHRFPIMWNNHFSLNENRISTFDRIGIELIDYAIKNPDLALIWRPHPALFLRLVEANVLSEADIGLLKQELTSAGVIVDRRDDHRHAFAASRALITDMSSFLLEYLTTGKPLLYTINPDGLPLTDEGQRLVRNYETAETAQEVFEFIGRIRAGKDPKRDARRKALPQFLAGFDGRAAHRAAEKIYSIAVAA